MEVKQTKGRFTSGIGRCRAVDKVRTELEPEQRRITGDREEDSEPSGERGGGP